MISSTSSSRKRKPAGFILQSSVILALIVAGSTAIGLLVYVSGKAAEKKRQDIEFGIQIQSGIETMLLAYRLAEIKYIKAVADGACATANPFLRSLKYGHACPGLPDVTVFTGTDEATAANLYSYVNNCVIQETGSNCSGSLRELVNVGVTDVAQKFQKAKYRFFINSVVPEKNIVEMISQTDVDNANNSLKRSFAIRPVLPNAAHLESDGRVTQENPDPLARCPGTIWADFLYFHPTEQKCKLYVNLGGGTGLAFYHDRYFGFRPAEGMVIDMLAASDGSPSYIVNENGTIGAGTEVMFPPHTRADLINTDDLTVVEDQIFYVALGGPDAYIGALYPNGTTNRFKVCDLASMGWAQTNNGIAALSWSDPLMTPGTSVNRAAIFFLKTDGGNLFTAVVRRTSIVEPPDPSQFQCAVFKDASLQQDEYQRTYGFDRTADSKPYFIY